MALIVIFAILFIILPALSPHINMGALRLVIKGSQIIGWFLGYLIGVIVLLLT